MRVSQGYSTGYSHERVKQRAEHAARSIEAMIAETGADTVIVHGNSGVSCGFAALMLTDFNLCLLRKDNDNSHGSPLEGPANHNIRRYIILDDMIDTGSTVHRIREKLEKLADQSGHDTPRCVGIVLYGTHHRTDYTFATDGLTVPLLSRKL